MLKLILSVVSLSLVLGVQAQARVTKSFECTSKLDYAVWKNGVKEIKTIDFKLQGERSQTDTLTGGAFIQAGNLWFTLNLPSYYLSDSAVTINGNVLKEQASLSFVFFKNSNGSYNSSNSVAVSVRHHGHLITARNKILGTADKTDFYPIVCSIE